jgi:cytochrome c556
MRVFISILLLVAVGFGVAGFALGWFKDSSSPNEEKRDVTLTLDPEKMKQDRDKVVGFLHSSPKGEKTDAAAVDGAKKNRDEFQQQAETRLQAMDRGLTELRDKARTVSGKARDRMNEAVDDLGKRTESARADLEKLQSASQEGYDAVKTRFSAAMESLKAGFEKAGAQLQ